MILILAADAKYTAVLTLVKPILLQWQERWKNCGG